MSAVETYSEICHNCKRFYSLGYDGLCPRCYVFAGQKAPNPAGVSLKFEGRKNQPQVETGPAKQKGNKPGQAKGLFPMRLCPICKEHFRPANNRQKFCEHCQRAGKNDRVRAWMRGKRNGGKRESHVDV